MTKFIAERTSETEKVPRRTFKPAALLDAQKKLGARLFSDPLLSRDGTMSCATCHDPKHAFTTDKPPVRGGKPADERLRRDIPSLLDVGDVPLLHHDGREPSLEVQILAPLFNEAEMGNTNIDELLARLKTDDEYREILGARYGAVIAIGNLGTALAEYERTLRSRIEIKSDCPEGYYTPELNIFDCPAERVKFELFDEKAGCGTCHSRQNGQFTTHEFLNTGIGWQSEQRRARDTPGAPTDRGREEVTHKREDRYKFRTPTLRNVELTAPYMHDGSMKTLEDVVAYYNAGGSADPEKDPRIKPLGLSDAEQKQLVAFLKSLTSIDLKPLKPPVSTSPQPGVGRAVKPARR